MKLKNLVALALITLSSSTLAQKIILIEGDLKYLQEQKGITIRFSYDSMIVGEESEQTYVEKMKDRWNAEEAGKGDEWKQKWFEARTKLYEPAFRYSFSKASGISTKSETNDYTLLVTTAFSEPGFNVPGIAAKRSQINAEASLVKTDDPTKVIARIMLSKFKSQSVKGGDFGVDLRLQEAYITAGNALGKFIKSKASK